MEEKQNLLTIKEFAQASKRSPQTIYKQISTRLISYVHEIEGQKYIERKALTEVFQIGIQPEDNNSDNYNNNQVDTLIAMLQAELEIKNKQIEDLSTALAAAQQTAQAAQALHAGTIQKQLTDSTGEQEKKAFSIGYSRENSSETLNSRPRKIIIFLFKCYLLR